MNVYVDLNGDGVRQGSEPFATTDTNGMYQIVSIPAGNYAARVDTNSLPAGVRPTFDLDGISTPNAVSLTISNGQVFTGLNFGYVGSGSVSGYLWSDVNGDGVKQAGEPGLSGVNVFIDLNANGVREPNEPYVVSGPDGSFAFNYLVADTYRIAIDLLSLPPDMRPTFDLDGINTPNVATITLGAGQNTTNANFGYQGHASLAGVVTDAFTSLPIAGATVVVVDSLGTTQTVTTDPSGDYNVVSLWTGLATLTVSRTGYLTVTATPTIVGGTNTQNEVLTPNTLVGVVTNTVSGQPIAGATVLVVDNANVTNTLTTDASGHYAITNIAAGIATVTASQIGYTTATTNPTIAAGVNTQNLGLTANTLTGIVTDAVTSLPIAGATVQVIDSSDVVHSVTTDATGHYGVTNLPTGPAALTASQTGYARATSHPTITAGANTQDEALTANTLTGVVRDAISDLFIVGATVVVVDSANVTNTLTTDAAGHYALTNIAAGDAIVTASKTGYATATASPAIVAGANTQNLDLTANTLDGAVTNTVSGQPIAGAIVMVVDSANMTNTLTTDAGGHYVVTNIAAGIATVTASLAGYITATASPTIVVGPNTQDLGLTANTLTGVVTDALTGLPIAGATVYVTDRSSVVHTVTTDAAGHYGVTNLPTGSATLTASQTGYASATSNPIIVPGLNTQDQPLTANTLTGVVADAGTGLPIAGATVVVTDSSNVVHATTTAGTGNYGFTALPTGPATLTASQTGYTSAISYPTINPGPNTQNEELTANTLEGVVTDAGTHQPIAGATVQVVDSAGTTNILTTDASGYYGVTNIATGAATVTVSKTGFTTATVTPTIAAGPNTQDAQLTASTPTLALLSSIKAFVAGSGVLVRWQTASEVGSLSFDLYRQGASRDQWIKVNAEPILAANSAAGATYEVVDQGAKPTGTMVYRLVELEEQGTTRIYGPFTLRAGVAAAATPTPALAGQTAFKLVKTAAQARFSQSLAQGAASVPLTALDGAGFVKIITTNGGMQKVTAASLASLLSRAPLEVQAAISAGLFRLSNQGEPVSFLPAAGGKNLSFYAEPLKDNYADQNVYWLTDGTAAPAGSVDGQAPRISAVAGGSSATACYRAVLDLEQDLLAVPTLVRDPNQDYWMWQRLVAGLGMFDTASFSFALDHLSAGGSTVAQLTLRLMGGSEATHTVQATVNGTVVGQDTWQGRAAHNAVLEIPIALLVEGTNRLSLKALSDGSHKKTAAEPAGKLQIYDKQRQKVMRTITDT